MADRARVTVWIAGGLGNQLFQYATARRLALHNGVPLVLDHLSGFPRDFYKRKFLLGHFDIRAGYVEPGEAFVSDWGRLRRMIRVWTNRRRPLERQTHLLERERWFDPRMLDLKVTRPLYLEGTFQDENYFLDIRDRLLEELELRTAHDARNVEVAQKIGSVEAVCLHVRRLHGVPNTKDAKPLAQSSPWSYLDDAYYQRAVDQIEQRIANPHFFVFSDYADPDWLRANVRTRHPIELIAHNGADKDYEDFWLMGQCRHFIIANSTFSWWAAWLGRHPQKIVVAPKDAIGRMITSVPASWIQV